MSVCGKNVLHLPMQLCIKTKKHIIMEAIKTVNEELRGQKTTSLLIGYVVVLAAMFAAFEYTTRDVVVKEEGKIYESVVLEEDMIPITQAVFQDESVAKKVQKIELYIGCNIYRKIYRNTYT